jgi:uncharacterized DUF497 family protein
VDLEYDPRKEAINRRKHRISLARFAEMDPTTQIVTADLRQQYGEERWRIIGLIDARLYVAVITYRASRPRIISLRRANRREERMYTDHGY